MSCIVFLNGAFGAGKSSVADALLRRICGCRLFDPEEVGVLVRTLLPGWAEDFQDLPPWRSLVAAAAAEVSAHTGQTLIAPMAILRADYATEIATELNRRGMGMCHILLHADTPTLRARIDAHDMFPDDSRRTAQVAAFRTGKIADYERARREWMEREAHLVIDTTRRTPGQAADLAAHHITTAHLTGPPRHALP